MVIAGTTYNMVTELLSQDRVATGAAHLVLRVSGIKVLFSLSDSRSGVLSLELFGASHKVWSGSITLRTPPSRLTVEPLTLRDWLAEGTDSNWLRLPLDEQQRINLVRVLRLRNDENTPVEFAVPRRPGTAVVQWVNPITYRDTGCGSGVGYAVDQRPVDFYLSNDTLVAPLDGRLVQTLSDTATLSQTRETFVLRLEPGQKVDVGVYGIGGEVDRWADSGPLGAAFQNIRVPSTCHDVCVAHETPKNERQSGLSPLICTRWETRRDEAVIAVGVNRGPVRLVAPGESGIWPVRYADLDMSSDNESRHIRVIHPDSEAGWL